MTATRRQVLAGAASIAVAPFFDAAESMAAPLHGKTNITPFVAQFPAALKPLTDIHLRTAIGQEDFATFARLGTRLTIDPLDNNVSMIFKGLKGRAEMVIDPSLVRMKGPDSLTSLSAMMSNEGAHAIQLETGATNQFIYESLHGGNAIGFGLLMEMASDCRMLMQIHQLVNQGLLAPKDAGALMRSPDGLENYPDIMSDNMKKGFSTEASAIDTIKRQWYFSERNVKARMGAYFDMKEAGARILMNNKEALLASPQIYTDKSSLGQVQGSIDKSAGVTGFYREMAPIAMATALELGRLRDLAIARQRSARPRP